MESPRDDTTPVLVATTIDCADLETMTTFWGELLGVEFALQDQFGFLAHAEGRKVTIWLQRVDEKKVGKNRLHLDFVVRNLDATLERVVALGGSIGDASSWQGHVWRTCLDPEGNVFDIMKASDVDANE